LSELDQPSIGTTKNLFPIPHKNDRPSTTWWQLKAKAYNNNQFTVGDFDSSHVGLTGPAYGIN